MTVRQDRIPRTRVEEAERSEPSAAVPVPQSAAQVLALQRNAGNAAVGRLLGRFMVDQHGAAEQPGAAQRALIAGEINPLAPAAPNLGQWDGAGNTEDAAMHRMVLAGKLIAALSARLNKVMPEIRARANAPTVPIASFEGAGRAAKRVVDGRFGGLTAAAALTSEQTHSRARFSFEANRNLVDVTDPRYHPPDPEFIASWLSRNDVGALKAAREHNFDQERSREERDWVDDVVIAPFVSQRRRDLALYDVYGFGQAATPTIVFVPPVVYEPGLDAAKPAAGGPSPAERKARWEMWALLVHEYIHTLEHPVFETARGPSGVLKEGFCEMFTEEVLLDWIPKVRADKDPSLRAEVEGTDPGGKPWPGFKPEFVDDYSADEYADYVAHAKTIRRLLGAGGDSGVKAAFFQGHVEFVGLAPGGKQAASPALSRGEVVLPAGVSTWTDVSALTGVPVFELEQANPMLLGGIAPGQHVWAPGTRQHVVVAVTDTGSGVAETADQIAMQNGVTTTALLRANRGIDFSKLKAGDLVLIPRH